MNSKIRDLLLNMASHMAYMQGQLEAHHQLDELEDFYWYRESVALREAAGQLLLEEGIADPQKGGEP